MRLKKIRGILIAAAVAAISVSLSACGAKEEQDTAKQESSSESGSSESDSSETDNTEKESNVFGTFQSETIDGEAVDQEVFTKADLTMVNVWGTFCGPCIKEMPELGELSEEYADKGFQIVGLISDVKEPGDETAQEIISQTGADYTHIVLSSGLEQAVYTKLPPVVPVTVFVDKSGNTVGDIYTGARSKSQWAQIIDKLLGEVNA